ncbi:hypothetical protein PVAP13_6KG068100 [Panicum virgatum]|uniref:MATH domain-containing protein n=1 Tax=Panicum virgatum TaxID=38727 RepID=A0A8T0R7Y2_PANVG|nr:hypothetical protein PVAP13_6KG068100 [Panicum virgatum]
MPSSVPPPLLTGAAKPSRSASSVVARKAQGFQVFRIDGYSVTTALPGGERISSEPFCVGGRCWRVDYYPNGTDASKDDSDDFSLLDLAGTPAYELPKETAIFTDAAHVYGAAREEAAAGRGYACFITKEELAKRRESLLGNDSLAIRCDVGVAEVEALVVAPQLMRGGAVGRGMRRGGYYGYGGRSGYESPDEMYGEHDGSRSQPPPPDDKEYIRRCLTAQRPRQH